MLYDVSDLQTEFLVRNNRTTTDGFISDQMLNDWTRDAHVWAASRHKWPFTEGKSSTTFASLATDDQGYLSGTYPEGWKPESIRLLTIGGKRLEKVQFYKFQRFVEEYPSDPERIYTDYGRQYLINPTMDLSGTVTAWGQYTPLLDPTDKAAPTIFSNNAEEGNEAILEKITGYYKRREHLTEEAELHDSRATQKLEEIWKHIEDEQAQYQQPPKGELGMWERIDIVEGGIHDEVFRRDQF